MPPQIAPPNAFRTFATAHCVSHFCHRTFATAYLPPHICHRILHSLCRRDLPPKFPQLRSPTALCALHSALCALCAAPKASPFPSRRRRRHGGAAALPAGVPPLVSAPRCTGGPRNGRSTATAHNATALRCPSALHFCAAPLRGNARRIRHRPPRIYSTVYSRVAHNGQPAFYGYSLRVPISQSVLISRCDIKGVHTGIFPVYVYTFA